jgi:flagellar hook assembly protein FlgD
VGQKVKTLFNDYAGTGTHIIKWDGSSESDVEVSSGIYFYRVVAQENIVARKMILMK